MVKVGNGTNRRMLSRRRCRHASSTLTNVPLGQVGRVINKRQRTQQVVVVMMLVVAVVVVVVVVIVNVESHEISVVAASLVGMVRRTSR